MAAGLAGQAAWSAWIDEAKHADFLGVVNKYDAHLKKAGTTEWVGPCPHCGGVDRFSVNVKKGLCNCRSKCGVEGSTIDFVMTVTGCGFVEAVEAITGKPRPDHSRDETFEEAEARRKENAKRTAQYREREARQQALEAAKAKRDEQAISDVLERAVPLAGTYGEEYLRGRGLTPYPRLTRDIMFVPDLDYWGAKDNGTRSVIHLATLPAIIAIIRDFADAVIGISQTYLDPKEPRKWRPEGSPTNSPKKIRGEKKHGMIRLGRIGETLALAEGWENALAWHQLGQGPEDVTLAAAVDLGNLSGGSTGTIQHPHLRNADNVAVKMSNGLHDPKAPGVIIDPEWGVKSIILLADLDSESYATATHLRVAGRRFRAAGMEVDIAWPMADRDFNDVLIAQMGTDLGRAESAGASAPHH
jgi:CHC2 zinc finger